MNIFITGTNRGLGFELVKLLNSQHPNARLFISSRLPTSAFNQQWGQLLGPNKLRCYQLDLKESQHTAEIVKDLQKEGIFFDKVVANAGFGIDHGRTKPSLETATKTLDINFRFTIDFIKQFLPILSPKGRVVVVSAIMAQLNNLSQPYRNLLTNPKITQQQLLNIAKDYEAFAQKQDMGYYSNSAYRTSKSLLNSWCRFILPTLLKQGQDSIAMHPGWCKTDMGGKVAPMTAAEGAKQIQHTLLLKQVVPDKFYNTQFVDFVTCQPPKKPKKSK